MKALLVNPFPVLTIDNKVTALKLQSTLRAQPGVRFALMAANVFKRRLAHFLLSLVRWPRYLTLLITLPSRLSSALFVRTASLSEQRRKSFLFTSSKLAPWRHVRSGARYKTAPSPTSGSRSRVISSDWQARCGSCRSGRRGVRSIRAGSWRPMCVPLAQVVRSSWVNSKPLAQSPSVISVVSGAARISSEVFRSPPQAANLAHRSSTVMGRRGPPTT